MPDVLRIDDLVVSYGRGRRARTVLRNVSLSITAGTTVGLVGESGSGKTTLGRAVLGLTPIESGRVFLDGADITRLPRSERRNIAQHLQAVFQDPYSSLNPALSVREILVEPLRVQGVTGTEATR